MVGKKAHRDIPLQEITLRKYESPQNMEKKELVRKFLLSVGLLQPGDSRDIIVPLFQILLKARDAKTALHMSQLLETLQGRPGASAPNVRRQLRRLKQLKLVEKTVDGYRITEFGSINKIVELFIVPYIIEQTSERLKKYSRALD